MRNEVACFASCFNITNVEVCLER